MNLNQELAFVFDASRCNGCKACMIACKDKHDLPVGVSWRKVLECASGDWTEEPDGSYTQNVLAYYVSVSCNHCENPVCVTVCPTGAMQVVENGIVAIDPDRCIACGNCQWNCPYSAPVLDRVKKHMTKCDMCRDFLAKGKLPACVAACPSRALDVAPRKEAAARLGRADVAPLPSAKLTEPNLCLIKHRDSLSVRKSASVLANREEF
ncbi:4Fe-4S dicluster domain-containing protein [Desulfovibrio sp. Fe33]|uniref:4Fe-4S dicluster domain-containing protein n=1 Tax=Desulfovibrio sp. Fe33 TaxID=3020842 RepID=UPI00234D9AD4|nr:4Fe-4S dicluster domain-containing protein [Desulfovibrio sp. Fe33]